MTALQVVRTLLLSPRCHLSPPLWSEVHIAYGSSAASHDSWAKDWCTPLATARMQRWRLILAAYQYEIKYRKSAEHANAGALSRLVRVSLEEQEDKEEVYFISCLEDPPVTAQYIMATTRKDPF